MKLTPLKAIRKFCIECQGEEEKGSLKRIRNCVSTECFLWGFRMGHRPKKKKGKSTYASKRKRDRRGKFISKTPKKMDKKIEWEEKKGKKGE